VGAAGGQVGIEDRLLLEFADQRLFRLLMPRFPLAVAFRCPCRLGLSTPADLRVPAELGRFGQRGGLRWFGCTGEDVFDRVRAYGLLRRLRMPGRWSEAGILLVH
jgi:hypothetical protein